MVKDLLNMSGESGNNGDNGNNSDNQLTVDDGDDHINFEVDRVIRFGGFCTDSGIFV